MVDLLLSNIGQYWKFYQQNGSMLNQGKFFLTIPKVKITEIGAPLKTKVNADVINFISADGICEINKMAFCFPAKKFSSVYYVSVQMLFEKFDT